MYSTLLHEFHTKYRTLVGERCRSMIELCLSRVLLPCMLLALLAYPGVAQKSVLVLYDEQEKLPGLVVLDKSLRSTLNSLSSAKIDIYNESLDRSRFQEPGYDVFLRDYLRQKYSGKRLDVIISVMGPSLDFVLEHAEAISPGTPIVFCGIDRREIESRTLGQNVTGVLVKRDFRGTLEIALGLHPNTKKVVFIGGSSNFDKRLIEQANAELREYGNLVEIEYLTDFALDELLTKVSQLPPNTIILTSTVFTDNTGTAFVPHDVVPQIAQNANAPVYGFLDQFLGRGIVGGHLYSVEEHGKKAGEMVLRILDGQNIADTPIVEGGATLDMFDWREMQKWGISEQALPVGSVVQFKELTAWEQYKWEIIAISLLTILQTVLIGWLLILRSRRNQAVKDSIGFATLAETEQKRLEDVVSNVPGIVWESWSESGTELRHTRFVSDYAEKMLGYPVGEWLSTPGFLFTIIPDEDRKRVATEMQEIFEAGNQGIVQFPWLAKGGSVFWAEAHLVAICDETGTPVGLRGVTMDVTDRKIAEEKLRVSERELREAQRLSQIGSWDWDPESDTVTWTEELYRIAGIDPSRPAPNFAQHSKIYTPESFERLAAAVALALETGAAYELELEMVRADGRHAWISARGEVLRDDKNNNLRLRGTLQDITERMASEEAVRESEGRFRSMADGAAVLIWIADAEMQCTYFNKAALEFTGLSMHELCGEGWLDIVHKDDVQACQAAYTAGYESRKTFVMEYRLRRLDGEYRWVYDTGTPHFGLNGEFLGYIGSAVDIADRKLAEEALSESEERYRNVVETQTELICRYLPDTTLTFVNDAYCRYFGKTREDLIGMKFMDLIPAEARPTAIGHVEELLRHGHATTYEHEVIRPNGKRGWQQWVDNVVVTTNGHSRELQGIGRDITEKRQAEEELRASESRFRIMADSAPVLIWMCGPDKLCTYVNQGWLDFTGRTIDMELGSGWTVSIHPDDADRTSEIFDSAFERKEPFKLEYRLQGADGDFRWLYDSGTPRFSSEGEFLGYIGSCVDISDRKKAEEASKQAHEEVVRLQKQLQEENIYLKEVIKLEHSFEEIIGHCDALKYVLFKVEQVAPTDATVLISGETGTGKELVALAVHSTSLRRNRPLVKVNCAALSASLIESELFGHERGSFTGASSRKIGRFELADGATIFLDEVGELPTELQVKLLRVIQEGEFERLGSSKTLKVDVRIIAATNRDLEAEVRKGTFREDLLFRLNVFPITVPPLRERKEDIPELIEYFTSRFAKKLGKNIRSVSPASIRRLSEHTWPGNIRELANVIERSVINTQTETLSVSEIFAKPAATNTGDSFGTLEMIERKHITQILELTNWKIEGANGAARILDLNPSTLRTRMSKLGIPKQSELQ